MRRLISFRDFDWLLLTFVLIICSLGVLEIYSTTYGTKFAGAHVRQIYWILGGLVVMLAVSLINYQILLENANWFYVASVISLLAVAVFGKKYLGARRWIQLPGGQHFQPSEWVKLVLILMLAKHFSGQAGQGEREEASLSDIVKAGLIAGVPIGCLRVLFLKRDCADDAMRARALFDATGPWCRDCQDDMRRSGAPP